jgi:hypothetical protein
MGYIRGFLYKILGGKFLRFIDPLLRKMDSSDEKKINFWICNQHIHPVESAHSFDEVLSWFQEQNIDFINSYPSCEIFAENNSGHLKKEVQEKYT